MPPVFFSVDNTPANFGTQIQGNALAILDLIELDYFISVIYHFNSFICSNVFDLLDSMMPQHLFLYPSTFITLSFLNHLVFNPQ